MKILSWLIALVVSITFSLSSFANPKKLVTLLIMVHMNGIKM